GSRGCSSCSTKPTPRLRLQRATEGNTSVQSAIRERTRVKAIILAAGRGERLRPITDVTPKPLVEVGGKALIVRHVEKLVAAGISQIVINLAHLGAQIEAKLGTGRQLGADITYSHEAQALGTAGGIANALKWLGNTSFAAVNADVYSDYSYARLARAV